MGTVFAEVDALPGAEGETATGDGDGQRDTAECGLGMGGHIVAALQDVLVGGKVFGCQTIEDGFHVGADIRVTVLVDGQSAAGVLAEEVQQPSLGERGQLPHDVARDEMEAPRKGTKGNFLLLNHKKNGFWCKNSESFFTEQTPV